MLDGIQVGCAGAVAIPEPRVEWAAIRAEENVWFANALEERSAGHGFVVWMGDDDEGAVEQRGERIHVCF